jgi:cyclopropane fatty-acyl-phospholipid synthase-like methyltransferase
MLNPPWDTNQTPPEVYEFIENHPPGRALDLGCGTGTNVITLAKNGWEVTGVDFIPKAIRTARRKAARQGIKVEFHVGDVTNLDGIKGHFDLILDIGCFHSLGQSGMEAYRSNIKRFLSPGGTYLIYAFFRADESSEGSGTTERELELFSDFLTLIKREDGTERGIRKSAWITYKKPPDKEK